jgi:hypothetical protein
LEGKVVVLNCRWLANMIFLLILAVVSVVLATTAMIRYPLPASISTRVVLVLWFVGVVCLIALLCRVFWLGSQAHGTHIPRTSHVDS